MASTNQSPFYKKAELMFLQAKTNEEKLRCMEEMIKECPKHKSSEKMLANLKTRYIKLKEKIESLSKSRRKFSGESIKKEDMQAVIIGKTNSGKSSLISLLTNTRPEIAFYPFTTKKPIVGMMPFQGAQIQLIEIPAIGSEYYDRGAVNTADTILILITNVSQIPEIENSEELSKARGKRIIVFNKIDGFNENEKRRIEATLKSGRYNFVMISTKTGENTEELKEKIFKSFNKIRVFTKEPGKLKTLEPIILNENATVSDVAEKILKGFSKNIKEARITGPSSKFSNQVVSLNHELKDLDAVEFKTR